MNIFITKSSNDASWLEEFCKENNWMLNAAAQIEFSSMNFNVPEEAEVIFFSSKNGVRYFLKESAIPAGVDVACIGRETARVLRKNKIEPNYIGEKSGDPVHVGKEFVEFTNGRKIFFPTSNASLHTVANMFPDDQKSIASIYETKLMSSKIDDSDIYIFTSPSNVNGFFQANKLPESCKVIAWGRITESALADREIFSDFVLETAQKEELLEYLATL